MTYSLPSRGVLFGGLLILGLIVLSQSVYADAFKSVLYASYGLAIPVIFGLFILAGVYFSARHLLGA